jgi:hypothetical protein
MRNPHVGSIPQSRETSGSLSSLGARSGPFSKGWHGLHGCSAGGEAVLRRPVGGPVVMRAQCQHLIEVAEFPHVTLQAVPFAGGGHAGESGSFTVLRFEERDLPDVALTPAGTTRFIEQVAHET